MWINEINLKPYENSFVQFTYLSYINCISHPVRCTATNELQRKCDVTKNPLCHMIRMYTPKIMYKSKHAINSKNFLVFIVVVFRICLKTLSHRVQFSPKKLTKGKWYIQVGYTTEQYSPFIKRLRRILQKRK